MRWILAAEAPGSTPRTSYQLTPRSGSGPDTTSARLAAEDQHSGGGERPAVPEHDADIGRLDLGGRLTAHLADRLGDGEHAVHPGVRVGKASAVGVERQPAAWFGVAVGDERPRLALADEAEGLQAVDRHVRERVVDHQVPDVADADAGLGEGGLASQPEGLRLGEVDQLRD